jgi:hypothetical protein
MLMSTAPFASAAANLLTIRVIVPATASPGQTIDIFLEATFNAAYVNGVSFTLRVSYVDGGHLKSQHPRIKNFATGGYYANYTIPNNATGVYWVQASALYHKLSATDVAGVTIVPYGTAQSGSSLTEVGNLSSQMVALSSRVVTLTYVVASIAVTALIVAIAIAILLRKKKVL